MRISIIIAIGVLITNCWVALVNASLIRDPFEQPEQLPCNEQTEMLLKQIQVWQFKGVIKQFNDYYQQIWLLSDNQWLAISGDVIPNRLFPWYVQSLFTDKIIWQANLPEYCHDPLLWTMHLTE